ncbi:glutaredoxin family protein [Neobacillus sp. PS3-12]|jgi:glutaredoxin|uniref:glutaredoxin family protein n=1 Tax=Neobacillus sp. PS3-12 TaxID=3070677 RepID=UPI0027DF9ED3|nr:glutaredoxin family protein [Neobacillus sp. PS3-12]WML54688.1 glutaredoxin family protein [Neobacillus sp. PS3-12]
MSQLALTLYTRQQCHLCEQAKEAIMELKDEYSFTIEEFDIDQSDELTEKYGLMIPVLLINGKEAGFGQINKIFVRNRFQEYF